MKRLMSAWFLLLLVQPLWVAAEEELNPVTVAEVIVQPLQEELPLSGTTEALRDSELSPRIDGLVLDVFVNEGDWVEAGQKILELDHALADMQAASAQARVDEAQARYADATRQRKEFQSLRSREHVAANSLESAIAEENAARAALAAQQAELKRLQELASRHTLSAPFAGMVAEKHAETGQWVKADSAVIKLVALDTIRVRAPLPQRYYQQLARDSSARITFDALPGKSFSGKLAGLVSVGDQGTRSFPVFIDIENPQHTIAPGMSAEVFVELGGNDSDAILIPRDAVVLRADGSRIVWRVTEVEGRLQADQVKVTTGRAQGKLLEVLESSLQPGDRIVMLGNENLRPGQFVRLAQDGEER